MVFALTNELKVFKPKSPFNAISRDKNEGPSFSQALCLFGNPMNKENGGICNTDGMNDDAHYDVSADEFGRSLLTGSSFIDRYGTKLFTCIEIEVFALE